MRIVWTWAGVPRREQQPGNGICPKKPGFPAKSTDRRDPTRAMVSKVDQYDPLRASVAVFLRRARTRALASLREERRDLLRQIAERRGLRNVVTHAGLNRADPVGRGFFTVENN